MDFKKAKELAGIQADAARAQKELETVHIEAESDGLVITFDGRLKVVSVEFEDSSAVGDEKRLKKAISECVTKGITKATEIMNEKLGGVVGKLGDAFRK